MLTVSTGSWEQSRPPRQGLHSVCTACTLPTLLFLTPNTLTHFLSITSCLLTFVYTVPPIQNTIPFSLSLVNLLEHRPHPGYHLPRADFQQPFSGASPSFSTHYLLQCLRLPVFLSVPFINIKHMHMYTRIYTHMHILHTFAHRDTHAHKYTQTHIYIHHAITQKHTPKKTPQTCEHTDIQIYINIQALIHTRA